MLPISAYTVRPFLSHKVTYVGLPSLTPVSTVIRINNSKLFGGMILFVGGEKLDWIDWSQMFIPAFSAVLFP